MGGTWAGLLIKEGLLIKRVEQVGGACKCGGGGGGGGGGRGKPLLCTSLVGSL